MGARDTGQQGRGLARTLGVVSLGLGIPAVAAPEATARLIGLRPTDGTTKLLRGVGAQELGVAAGLLTRPHPTGFQWNRVLGDVTHLLLLGNALTSRKSDKAKVNSAITAVAGITLVDLIAALRLSGGNNRVGALEVRRTVTVRKPADEVYRYWRQLENLPDFMAHLESVESRGDGRSRWVAKGPAGTKVKWDAEITEETPGEIIAWRSVKGAKVDNSGEVRFAPAPGDRGTEITVELRYDPPAGRVGAAVAKLFGEAPEQQLADDLRRLKQVLETGEVVLSDALPAGTKTSRQLHVAQPPAQPASKRSR